MEVESSNRAVDSNKTPFGINKHVLLVLATVYAVLTGPHLFNWTVWESILKESRIFSSLCPEDFVGTICDAQQNRIAGLLSISTMFMFGFTFIAGFVLDVYGPKVCCLFGTTVMLLGWILLSLHRLNEKLMITLGFAFVGAGVDPSFFGTLTIANLFPSRSSTVISILGAARSLSNGIPVALGWWSMRSSAAGDDGLRPFTWVSIIMVVMSVLCGLTAALFVPLKPYKNLTQPANHVKVSVRKQIANLYKACFSPLYYPVVILTVVNLLRNNFYLASASQQLSSTGVAILTTMNVLAFLPGPVFGYLVDLRGPLVVILIIIITNLLMMSSLFIAQVTGSRLTAEVMGGLSVIMAFPGIGFLLSQVYCYIAIVFPPEDMGKLVGLACVIGGTCAMLCNPLYAFALAHKAFWAVDLGIIVATIGCFGIVAVLHRLLAQKTVPQLEAV